MTELIISSKISIHPLSVPALSLLWGSGGFCWSQSELSLSKSPAHCRVLTDGRGCHARCQHQEQFGVQDLAQGHFDMQLSSAREPGFEPATFQSLANLLYPLTYSCPSSKMCFHHNEPICYLRWDVKSWSLLITYPVIFKWKRCLVYTRFTDSWFMI